MDRSQKEIAVKEIEEIFDGAGSVVMAAYSGMTVAEMTELRAKLRDCLLYTSPSPRDRG